MIYFFNKSGHFSVYGQHIKARYLQSQWAPIRNRSLLFLYRRRRPVLSVYNVSLIFREIFTEFNRTPMLLAVFLSALPSGLNPSVRLRLL